MNKRLLATKEQALAILLVLHRNCHKLPEADYDKLVAFTNAAAARLPSQEAVERDLARHRKPAGLKP